MNSLRQQLIAGTAYSAIAKYSGMVIALIVTAILARLLPPEDFGIATGATVIISFLSMFLSFGFEPAIVQFRNLDEYDYINIFLFPFWSPNEPCRAVLVQQFYPLYDSANSNYPQLK